MKTTGSVLFIALLSLNAMAFSSWQDDFRTSAGFTRSVTIDWDTLSHSIKLGAPAPILPSPFPARDSTIADYPVITKGTEYPVIFPQRKGTVEFWVKGPFSSTAAYGNLFDTWDGSRNHIAIRTYGQYGEGAQAFFYDTTRKAYAWVVNFSPDSGAWNLLAITWDMDARQATLFMNGRPVTTNPVTGTAWLPSGQKVVFGGGYPGQIEKARILSRPLTPMEIREDYSNRYALSGTVVSAPVAPMALSSWSRLYWNGITPAGTGIRLFVEAGDSVAGWKKVPDSLLPGNSAGLTLSPAALTGLAGRYPAIRLKAELFTTDSQETPVLDSWGVEWLSGLSHPRVYLTPAKIVFLKDRLQRNIAPYTDFLVEIKKNASNAASKVPPSRTAILQLNDAEFRSFGNPLPDMAMAYLFTDSIRYWNGLRRLMDSVLIYPNWADNRDLGPSHILYNMAIVYDWLHDRFTPAERLAIEQKLAVHADTLHLKWKRNNSWLQNHNYVCMGAVMTAGVALYDAVPGAEAWVRDAYANFTRVLPLLSPDGVGVEDIPYWGYGLEALLRYFALEESFLRQDRIRGNDWFRNTWHYRLHNSIPGFWHVANFGDGPIYDWYGPGYMLQRLASQFNNPYAQWLSFKVTRERTAHRLGSLVDYRNMVWYDESVDTVPVHSLPTRALFPNMAQYASRSSWGDSNAVFFCTEAGPPMGYDAYAKINFDAGSGHQHPDKGHFILNGFNHFLVTDEGYTYKKRTAAHNIITFDSGKGQLGGDAMWFNGNPYVTVNPKPSFVRTDFSDHQEYLVADLAGAYPAAFKLTRLLRHYLFIGKGALLVMDEVESDTAHRMEWRINMDTLARQDWSNRMLTVRTADRKAGFLLQDLSLTAADSVYQGRFTQSDTFYADPERGYPKNIIHYASTQQFQMMKSGRSGRFDALIIPFKDSAIEPANWRRTADDTLVVTWRGLTVRVHAPSRFAQADSAGSATETDVSRMAFSLSLHPNPLNAAANIHLSLPWPVRGKIRVLDVRGRTVRLLEEGPMGRGRHTHFFDGKDGRGRVLSSGIYTLRLEADGRSLNRKIAIIR